MDMISLLVPAEPTEKTSTTGTQTTALLMCCNFICLDVH